MMHSEVCCRVGRCDSPENASCYRSCYIDKSRGGAV